LQKVKSQQHIPTHKNIRHIAGGAHCSAEPEQVARAGFDYVACGEGEQLLVQLCHALLDNDTHPKIRGLCYINANNEFVYQGRATIESLDAYPAGSEKQRKFGPIEITRGCIYACKFCQTPYVNKARFRHRSISQCLSFAAQMYAAGLRDFRFISPSSLSYGSYDESVNLSALDALLGGMRMSLGRDARLFFGSFPSEVRPEHISVEVLKLLKNYVDNTNLIIGAQSGSNSVLQACKRGHGVEQVKQACALCLDQGFIPNIDFLLGLPGETEIDRHLSLDLAESLANQGAKIHLHSFMPLPGTPYANHSPSMFEPSSLQRLNNLCSSGKAYGQWQKQQRLAKQT
jgi:B12-binding domain/radical SAM domain protein